MDEFFGALPSAVEQVGPTCAKSVKCVDRRTRSASCADGETGVDRVQGRWQAIDVGEANAVRMAGENTKRKEGRASVGTAGSGSLKSSDGRAKTHQTKEKGHRSCLAF